jgi:diguanylate cyclase (GGDEF)-like protein
MQSLTRYSRLFHIAAGLMTVVILGLVDYLTGPETSLAIFYLVPIVQVTWFGGSLAGIVTALSSAIVWLASEMASSQAYVYRLVPAWNTILVFVFLLAFSVGLSLFRDRLSRQAKSVTTDSLTGVDHAGRFHQVVQMEKDRAVRYKHPLTLGYVDVDNLREFNRRFGRRNGNTLLRTVAATIRENVRTSDTVARLGGDEFGILLVEVDMDEAETVVFRTRQNLLAAMEKHDWPVTFSFGVMTFRQPASSVDEMLHLVTALADAVKAEGKDSVKFEIYSD